MSFVTLAEARLHLRVDCHDEDALIWLYISAAEQAAINALDRGVYADSTALGTARAAAPGELDAAIAAYEAAIAAAGLLTDEAAIAAAVQAAGNDLLRAKVAYRQVFDGIVVNDQITAAVLLTVGHLYAHREDAVVGASVSALPNGADHLLQPYKVYA